MKRRNFLQLLTAGSGAAFTSTLLPDDTPGTSAAQQHPELSKHTVEDIEFKDVRLKYPRLVGKNSYKGIHGRGPTVKVGILTTDKGVSGWGLVRGRGEYLQNSASYVTGKKITDIFNPDIGVTDKKALPFDISLHDLAGVILDQPVYEMLGRKEPFVTNCYSGMIYFDEFQEDTLSAGLDRILEECEFDYNHGYRQLKIKIGRGNKWMSHDEGLKRDIRVTKLIAENFPDVELLVDANNGYSLEDTIAYLEGIGDIDLFWFEEPFHENREDYLKLRKWLMDNGIEVLLADGEYKPEQELLRKLYRQRLLDVHLTDIIGLGFTPWRKLLPQLGEMGILASPHGWGSQLKTYYISHLYGGLGNMPTIEGVTCTSEDIDFGKYRLEEGKLTPSPDPGFGMELI